MRFRVSPGCSLDREAFGPPEGVLSWEPVYESDDEGVVHQPSFDVSDYDPDRDGPGMRPDDQKWRRVFGPVRSARTDGPSDLTVEPQILDDLTVQFLRDLDVPTLPGQPKGENYSHAVRRRIGCPAVGFPKSFVLPATRSEMLCPLR